MRASAAYLGREPSDYIGGAFRALSGDGIVTRDPANPASLVWQGTPVPAHAEEAVEAARRALPAWSALPLPERRAALARWRETCVKHAARLAAAISREVGKVKWEAELEAKIVAEKVTITLEDRVLARVAGFEVAAGAGKTGICTFKPHGVMAVLGPYNFPAHLPNGHIVPALLLGNTVVFKPSEKGASVGQLMAELAHEAGFPAGVLNVVQGGGAIVGDAHRKRGDDAGGVATGLLGGGAQRGHRMGLQRLRTGAPRERSVGQRGGDLQHLLAQRGDHHRRARTTGHRDAAVHAKFLTGVQHRLVFQHLRDES